MCLLEGVGSRRAPIQALSPGSNWATGNELGLAYMLEGMPREQWVVKERKLDHPKYYGRRERHEKVIPMEKVRN